MNDEDKRMLDRLSAVSDRSASLILRELVRAEYRRQFQVERPLA
jgi:predicted transcriptional regulator